MCLITAHVQTTAFGQRSIGTLFIAGVATMWAGFDVAPGALVKYDPLAGVVPPGSTYIVTFNAPAPAAFALLNWMEVTL